jgi:hypothetical protein
MMHKPLTAGSKARRYLLEAFQAKDSWATADLIADVIGAATAAGENDVPSEKTLQNELSGLSKEGYIEGPKGTWKLTEKGADAILTIRPTVAQQAPPASRVEDEGAGEEESYHEHL